MQFGDLNAASGLQTLDGHLADKSYIGGYLPTQADLTVLKAMSGAPAGDYVNALRWFKHISSFVAAETAAFAKADFDVLVAGGAAPKAAAAPARPAKKVEEEEDDDDFDMFGSDDEVDEEAERIKAERLAAGFLDFFSAYAAKRSALILSASSSTSSSEPNMSKSSSSSSSSSTFLAGRAGAPAALGAAPPATRTSKSALANAAVSAATNEEMCLNHRKALT